MGFFSPPFFDTVFFDPLFWGTGVDQPYVVGCWSVLPDGGDSTGVSPGGSNYPFISSDAVITWLIADAYLAHRKTDAVLPLSITWLYGFDRAVNCGTTIPGSSVGSDPTPQHLVEVLIVDAIGAVTFDSTVAAFYSARAFGDRLLIHEWRTSTAVCRIVQHTAVAQLADALSIPRSIVVAAGVLDARVSELLSHRVESLGTLPAIGTISTDIVLVEGYNVAATTALPATEGLRRVTEVTISGTPGGGLGRSPGCATAATTVRSIDGVTPDATGNLAMVADGCHWLRRAPGDASSLQLGYDCKPCCDCPDYENLQLGILGAWSLYSDSAVVAAAVVTEFEADIARWAAQKACREARVVRINAVAVGGYVQVAVSLCNTTSRCLFGPTVSVDMTSVTLTTISVDPAATILVDTFGYSTAYALDASVPNRLTATWPLVAPQSVVAVHFRLNMTAAVLTLSAFAEVAGATFGSPASRVINVPGA